MSCLWDRIPDLYVTNGYEFDVVVNTVYYYGNVTRERTDNISPGESQAVNMARSKWLNDIISIRIQTSDSILLAEYTPEYIDSLWKIYKKKKFYTHNWIFTEKGLFMRLQEINERYDYDKDKIMAYYRSDEVVQDLQKLLKTE
jgi:alpha-L-arabinofuranosidase